MGNDQGDVPLSYAVQLFSGDASRMGAVLFAFLLFALPVTADDDLPDRCGAGMQGRPDRIHGLKHGTIQATRPMLATFADSPSGRFRVHYDTTGVNAVDLADASANGIPDYIDECLAALEHAWAVEIDTLGYKEPPSDSLDGGSGALDVYVRDLGPQGFYGIASPDRLMRQSPTELWTSFLELDNDYSPTDSTTNGRPSYTTTGLDGLRITCAHEFHHAVQNGAYGYIAQHRMLYEMTSTWMEIRCWSDVRDWAFYTKALLERPASWPFSRASGSNGYVWGWFGNVLATLPGNVLRSTWELIGQGRMPFAALVEACKSGGSSFEEAMCRATEALYRTGTRAQSNSYLPGAQLLPELAVGSTLTASGSSATFTGSMATGEVRTFRFNLVAPSSEKANADVVLAISDGRLLASDTLRDRPSAYGITLNATPGAQDVPLASTGWGARVMPDIHCFVVEGSALVETGGPFPQPLDLTSAPRLWVPVSGTFIGQEVKITVLDLDMRPVFNESVRVEKFERRIVAPVDLNPDLAPGTYLLYLDVKSSSPILHKIFVR